jgi:hypothetical protein
VGLGDDVGAHGLDGPVEFTVVGRSIDYGVDRVDGGFVLTLDGLSRITEPSLDALAVRLTDDADVREVFRRYGAEASVDSLEPPSEVGNLGQLGRLPLWTGAVLAALGTAALLHALVVITRGSRLDAGIHRALGLTRGQIRSAGITTGVAVAGTGALLGVVLGWIAGRFMHSSLVRDVGAIVETVVPGAAWLVVIGGAGVCVALSTFAGVRLARMSPARALRSE